MVPGTGSTESPNVATIPQYQYQVPGTTWYVVLVPGM